MTNGARVTPETGSRFFLMFAEEDWADQVAEVALPVLGEVPLEIYYDTTDATGAPVSFDIPNAEIPRSPNAPADLHPRQRMGAAIGLIVAQANFAGGNVPKQRLSVSLARRAQELDRPRASLLTPEIWRSLPFQSYNRGRLDLPNQHRPPNRNVVLTMPLAPQGRAALESWLSMILKPPKQARRSA